MLINVVMINMKIQNFFFFMLFGHILFVSCENSGLNFSNSQPIFCLFFFVWITKKFGLSINGIKIWQILNKVGSYSINLDEPAHRTPTNLLSSVFRIISVKDGFNRKKILILWWAELPLAAFFFIMRFFKRRERACHVTGTELTINYFIDKYDKIILSVRAVCLYLILYA